MMGRPREFCTDQALERALEVFWRQGYEGASLTDLTESMGITRPSLYAAFGNKEQLFRKALDLYGKRHERAFDEALSESTSHGAVEHLLMSFAGIGGGGDDEEGPRGCLMVQGALACSEAGESIRQELCSRRARDEVRLRDRLQVLKAEGDLPEDADPFDLARYVMTVANGMAVQAAGGASNAELRRVARITMSGWPARPAPRGDAASA